MYIYLRVEKEQATWLADGQNLQDRAVKKGKDPQGKNFQNGNKKSSTYNKCILIYRKTLNSETLRGTQIQIYRKVKL